MSFHGDDYDSNRNSGGQITNHTTSSVGEQWSAGVNHNDSYTTADNKIETYRRANNLNPYTGVPLPPPIYVGGSGGFMGSGGSSQLPSHGGGDGESWFGAALKGLFMALIFWPAVVAIVLGAIAAAAVFAGRSMDAPTLAAQVAGREFALYQLTPLSKLFPEKVLATPVDPAGFVSAMRAGTNKTAKSQTARLRQLQGQAYRCMFQPGCRAEVARVDPFIGQTLPRIAGGFLVELAKAGNEDATRDLCFFAIKAGTSYKDLLEAGKLCAWANVVNKGSKAGTEALDLLENSWPMRRAWAYGWADELQNQWTHLMRGQDWWATTTNGACQMPASSLT